MKILQDTEKQESRKYIEEAIKIAELSTCQRAKCGSIIVKNNEIIGKGFNSPPNEKNSQRRCLNNKDEYQKIDAPPHLKNFKL